MATNFNLVVPQSVSGKAGKVVVVKSDETGYELDTVVGTGVRSFTAVVGFTDADYTCDGTDDDVQIQAAIDDVAAAGGGTVFLQAGSYDISATVELDSYVTLVGEGDSTLLTAHSGLSGVTPVVIGGRSVALIDPLYDISVKNIKIDGNESGMTTPWTSYGILLLYCYNSSIENVTMVNGGYGGLSFGSGAYNTISECRVDSCGICIDIRNVCDYFSVRNNVVTNALAQGIHLYRSSHGVCADNTVKDSNVGGSFPESHGGIWLYGDSGQYSQDNLIDGNVIVTGTLGIAEDGNFTHNNRITNNTISGMSGRGISISNTTYGRTIVSQNHIKNCGATGISLLSLYAKVVNNDIDACEPGITVNGDNHLINGNYFYNSTAGSGIVVYTSNGTIISGNHCFNNDIYGIQLIPNSAISDITIVGNYIYNNSYGHTGTYNGIHLDSNHAVGDRISITDNHIYDNQVTPTQRYGIYSDSGYTNVNIFGNTIHGNTDGDINSVLEASATGDLTTIVVNNISAATVACDKIDKPITNGVSSKSLILYYPFFEDTGDFFDYSVTKTSGVVHGTVTRTKGIFGNYINFGANIANYLSFSVTPSSLDATISCTLDINTVTGADINTIIWPTVSSGSWYYFTTTNTGTGVYIQPRFYDSSGNLHAFFTGTKLFLDTTQIQRIVFTFTVSGADTICNAYINGVLQRTETITSAVAVLGKPLLGLGDRDVTNTDADIYSLKIYDRVLTAQEVWEEAFNPVETGVPLEAFKALASTPTVPTAITVANEASDTTCFPSFFTGATGDLGPKTNAGLTFNSSTATFGASNATVTNTLQLGTSPTVTNAVGAMYWDDQNLTPAVDLLRGGGVNNVTLQIGQETYVRATNKTGSTINNGKVVYINGSFGNKVTVTLAQANSHTTSKLLGVTTHDIADGATGYVTVIGTVSDVNTNGMTAGDQVYLSATVAGSFTNVAPSSPNVVAPIGVVEIVNTNNGRILINTRQPLDADTLLSAATNEVAPTQLAVKTYADTKSYFHGVLARPVAAGTNPLPTALTSTTFTLGATANPVTYYYTGTKVVVSADKTCTLDDGLGGSTAGLYYVYFNAATGNILATKGFPGILTTSNILIATVKWNGTDYGLVNDERHAYNRNCQWHEWAHDTIGARWQSGIVLTASGTGAAATMATTLGSIHDEDIDFVVNAGTTCRLFWQDSATTYTFDKTASTVPFKRGANNRPQFVRNDTYALVEIPAAANRYLNFFFYATTDLSCPIYCFVETGSNATILNGYTSLANARAIPFPNLSQMGNSPELKPIYRVIVNGDGLVQTITAADDYRAVSSLPGSAGSVSTVASGVTFVPYSTISSGNVQNAIEELVDETVPTSRTLTINGTAYDLSANRSWTITAGANNGLFYQVRCASTADVVIASALKNGDTIDGVTLATGDKVLLKNQTTASENGVYIVVASGAASRATDYNSDSAIRGSKVLVQEGTANAGFIWACGNTSAITVDSTSITYTKTVRETITANTTLNVKASPGAGEFASVQAALDFLSPYEISASATVTISIEAGTFTSANILVTHPNGDRISIVGATTYTKSISSVQSSGARTSDGTLYYKDYIVVLNDIANIAVNDYATISQCSGGTNPLHLHGCNKISALNYIFTISTGSATAGATYTNNGNTYTVVTTVSSGTTLVTTGTANNWTLSGTTLTKSSGTGDSTLTVSATVVGITMRVYGDMAGSASGNVTTSICYICKTILSTSSGNGISLSGTKLGNINNVILTSSGSGASEYGITLSSGAAINIGNVFGVTGYSFGIYANSFSVVGLFNSNCCVSACRNYGIYSNAGSYINTNRPSVNGCGSHGYYSASSASIVVGTQGYAIGNVGNGVFCERNAYVSFVNGSAVDNTTTAQLKADGMSFIYAVGATGANPSPAVNTYSANSNSFIQA